MPVIEKNHPGLKPVDGVNLNGEFVVINIDKLNGRYKSANFQLVQCTGGFGCSPSAIGRKIYTKGLDGEETSSWDRYDFIGIANDEIIELCKADSTAPIAVDPNKYCFMVIAGKQGETSNQPTIAEAMKLLRKKTITSTDVILLCHAETQFDGMFLSTPPEAKEKYVVKPYGKDGYIVEITDHDPKAGISKKFEVMQFMAGTDASVLLAAIKSSESVVPA